MEKTAQLARLIRYFILTSTTAAGSGHTSSSLSAVDLMVVLFFESYFHFDPQNPEMANNDRLIFSKGHAAPLFYALWAAAGVIPEEEILTLRKFGSRLEGHPTFKFPLTEVPTGSLGQGLSVGVGMAINGKYLDKLPYRTFVLLGDSEMAEGQNWEAIQLAAYYKLDNLVAIIDVNRLGQRGETMIGDKVLVYQERLRAFGWATIIVDGHNLHEIADAYTKMQTIKDQPVAIIAKTLKGKGVFLMEDKDDWHAKVLDSTQLAEAVAALGEIDKTVRGVITLPENKDVQEVAFPKVNVAENFETDFSVREASGHALVKLLPQNPGIVVLDAEMSNSTFTKTFESAYPTRFFEMFIAEQNMVSVALGLALRGKIPCPSTFAAFFTRSFDQLRMASYAGEKANIKITGTHPGVAIGQDGYSQMGLEDIAMFRTLSGSVVLYPADHVAEEKLMEQAVKHQGLVYVRATREKVKPIYKETDEFTIGGSKVVKSSPDDRLTLIAAGTTLYEALLAYDKLVAIGIKVRVVDLYSVKPVDQVTLEKAAIETRGIIVVEDHYPQGGMADAVREAVSAFGVPIYSLAVTKIPCSGKPAELLSYEAIDCEAIIAKVKEILR